MRNLFTSAEGIDRHLHIHRKSWHDFSQLQELKKLFPSATETDRTSHVQQKLAKFPTTTTEASITLLIYNRNKHNSPHLRQKLTYLHTSTTDTDITPYIMKQISNSSVSTESATDPHIYHRNYHNSQQLPQKLMFSPYICHRISLHLPQQLV